MAMLRVCTADGCETKTLGLYCVDHEHDASDDLNQTLKSAVERSADPVESGIEQVSLDPGD